MSSKVLGALLGALLGAYMALAFPAGLAIAWGLDQVGVNPLPRVAATVIVPTVQKIQDRLPTLHEECETFDGLCLDMDQDYIEVPTDAMSPEVKSPGADFEYVWGPHFQTV